MKKRITSTLIAFAVTCVWLVIIFRVMLAEGARISINHSGYNPQILIFCATLNLVCICSIPALFIRVYERLNKDDTSRFKHIFAAIFSIASASSFYYYIGNMTTPFLYHKQSNIIAIVISVIFPTLFIFLRGRCSKIGSKKAVKIKNKINAASAANFTSVLAITLSVIVCYTLPGKKYWEIVFIPESEISLVISKVLCGFIATVGGIVFLSAYESRSEGKGVIKYVQWILSQFIVLLSVFNLMNEYTRIDFDENLLRAALFTAFSLIPVIICLITELAGKSLTRSIVAGIRKLLKKPQGGIVRAEKTGIIKRTAKILLGSKIFAGGWLMMILAEIIYGALNGFAALTLIGGLLVSGPIAYGLARIEMNVVTGKKEQADLADLFSGFPESFTQTIVLKLLQSIFLSLWSMLFIIPGILKSYSYSMSFYIQQQAENKNWRYALNESKRLMHGNRFRLFLLDLSFIGWYILGSMCFGIGVLFVMPYHKTARAVFFNSLLLADKKIKEEGLNNETELTISDESNIPAQNVM